MSQPAARAWRTGRAFTLATSVYQRASPAACARASVGATACGGTASTATSAGPPGGGAGGTSPGSTVPAPMSAARRAAAGSESASHTATPRGRRASAIEVPISPVPITMTLAGEVMVLFSLC